MYKVNPPPTLDIYLIVASIEYCEEPFKGLSCPVPLGQPVHSFVLKRVFFSILSAWICTLVWQVNGAQQQTPCYDLQSDLIFCLWLLYWLDIWLASSKSCSMSWCLWHNKYERIPSQAGFSSIELLKLTCHGVECLHVHFFCQQSRTVQAITEWFAWSQSMIFSPSVNWGGVFLSLPAFPYVMSNIYISLNFKCCQE